MKPTFLPILLLAITTILAHIVFAQKPTPNIDIGLGLEGTSYMGDLNLRSFTPQIVSMGVSASARFSKNPHFYNHFQVGKFALSDQSSQYQVLNIANIYEPTYYFTTNVFYASYQLQYFPFKNYSILPFFKAGLAASRFTPFDKEGNNLSANVYSREDGERFSSLTYFLPVGAGLQFKINPICFFTVDYNYNFLGTDYIDNIGNAGKEKGKDAFQSLKVGIWLRVGQMQTPPSYPIAAPNPKVIYAKDSLQLAKKEAHINKKNAIVNNDTITQNEHIETIAIKPLTNIMTIDSMPVNKIPNAIGTKTDSAIEKTDVSLKETISVNVPKNIDTAQVQLNPPIDSASKTINIPKKESPIHRPNKAATNPNLSAPNLVVLGNRSLDYQYSIIRMPHYPTPPEVVLQNREAKIKAAILGEHYFDYEVQADDSWESLAKDFDIPESILRAINNANGEDLPAGIHLTIPDVKD